MTPTWLSLLTALLVAGFVDGVSGGRLTAALHTVNAVLACCEPGAAPHPIWHPGIRLLGWIPYTIGVIAVVVGFAVFWSLGFPTYGTADERGPKLVKHWTRSWWGPLVFGVPAFYLAGSVAWERLWPGWTP